MCAVEMRSWTVSVDTNYNATLVQRPGSLPRYLCFPAGCAELKSTVRKEK